MIDYLTGLGHWGKKDATQEEWSRDNDKGADVVPYSQLESIARDLGISPFPMAPNKKIEWWMDDADENSPMRNADDRLHPADDIKGWDVEHWFCNLDAYANYKVSMTQAKWDDIIKKV